MTNSSDLLQNDNGNYLHFIDNQNEIDTNQLNNISNSRANAVTRIRVNKKNKKISDGDKNRLINFVIDSGKTI